jgi:hypothetical protein
MHTVSAVLGGWLVRQSERLIDKSHGLRMLAVAAKPAPDWPLL